MQISTEILTSWSTFWATIIALVALARPEITKTWNHFFKPPNIEFHLRPSSQIIVAFRAAPMLWIDGTIESIFGNHLIENISICVTRQSDKKTHEFGWCNFETAGSNSISIPAYVFTLYEKSTQLGLFGFSDSKTKEKYSQTMFKVKEEFSQYRRSLQVQRDIETDFWDFCKTQPSGSLPQQALEELKRINYWHIGTYDTILTFTTRRPKRKKYSYYFDFSLSAEDQKTIEDGLLMTIFNACTNIFDISTFRQVSKEIENYKKDI
jgi:hypothetical protein